MLLLSAAPAMACTTANWDGGVTGTVGVNGKAYEGSCGAKIQIGAENLLTDLHPSNEKVYIASFYAFLGEMSLGADDQVIIFSADQDVEDPEVELRIDRIGVNHLLVLKAYDDAGATTETAPVPVNYGWNQIQFWWEAASGAETNDGSVILRLNGVDVASIESLDNDLGAINQAQLGRIGGTLSSPDRFFDVDLFDSRRTSWVDPYRPFNDLTSFVKAITVLYDTGITGGCGGGRYCPNDPITRAQMAVFILRAMLGSYHTPAALPPAGSSFTDVEPANKSHFATWVEEFYVTGITSGCGPDIYCPTNPVTRGQMAVFILRGIEGASYTPPPLPGGVSSFTDVTTFARWIEELYQRGITGGCGGTKYCPDDPVTRGQMAAFLGRGFELPLQASQATNSQ